MQQQVQTFLSKLASDINKSHILKIVVSIFFAYSMVCHADYKKIIDKDFWKQVYPSGGKTFYCDAAFDKASPILTVSHIYPTGLINKQFGCRSQRSCMRSNPIYEKIMSDLHNMVPVNSFYHFKLKDSVFGMLDESDEGNECGIKKRYNVIEPPDRIKGDIARIHFYMHTQYDLPLNSNFLFLKSWAKNDPPSKEEIDKNNRIKEIQGNENTYISNPSLVDQLEF